MTKERQRTDIVAIIELHKFHGYYEQRWNVIHVWNGYYKIISTYSDKALTAPTGANNDVVTQTSYTGADTQKWKFIEQSDGTYKICPKSNLNFFMAAGDISITADQDLEIRTAQSDGGDRWEICVVTTWLPFEEGVYFLKNIGAISNENYLDSTVDYQLHPSFGVFNTDNTKLWYLTHHSEGYFSLKVNSGNGGYLSLFPYTSDDVVLSDELSNYSLWNE